MFKFIVIVCAFGIIFYAVRQYRDNQRVESIEEMTPDELVDAVIRREISILEVPQKHREAVNEMLDEIQNSMNE